MKRCGGVVGDFFSLVGKTPLIRLRKASEMTGCNIYGKCEFLNPGASVKDRAAVSMILDAERRGLIKDNHILEATAGNTGIGLTLAGNARGYKTTIVMPSNQTEEKKAMLRNSGATLIEVPAAPYRNPNNYARWASRLADKLGIYFTGQFDNTANRQAHIDHTGPEIWEALDGKVDAFSCAMGTGGTLAGVAQYLRSVNPAVRIGLTDPQGAMLYRFYRDGELKAEGGSITEGIGQARITGNMKGFRPDELFEIDDHTAMSVLFDLLKSEGLSLGLSTGINVAGAIEMAKCLGPGHTVVTILCDYAQRYERKTFDMDFLAAKGLPTPDFLVSSTASVDTLDALRETKATKDEVAAVLEAYAVEVPAALTQGFPLP